MEMEREKIRIFGEDFEKWKKESAKNEREQAKNAEIKEQIRLGETEKELAKEKMREKARIWCEVN